MENSRKRIKSKIWNDGYGYVCNSIKTGSNGSCIKYMKCQDALCRVSVKMIDGELQGISRSHNHPRKDIEIKKGMFKEQLKALIQKSTIPVKDAYNNIAAKDPTGALHCPVEGLASSMRRWRKEGTCTAPKPDNLVSLGECLESGTWKHISRNYDGAFYNGQVTSEDNNHALVFGNTKFIAISFKDSQELFIDINFRLAPRDPFVNHLVTIFAVANSKYIFPIAYILMESDSELLYKAVFKYFQTKIAPDINPKFIICPYEISLNTALRSVYANSNIHGSFFHYVKTIHAKARALGITNHLDNDEVLAILKRYYTVPLFPYNMIQDVFNELQGIRPDMFSNLWNYISKNWIDRIAVHMCVFGQPHRNHAFWTHYNLRLNNILTEKHPEMSKLIGEIKKIHGLARAECKRLNEDKDIEKMVFSMDELFHQDLRSKWSFLTEGTILVSEFKSSVSNFVDKYHVFFNSFYVDEDKALTENLPTLRNTLFRPHSCQL